MNRLWRPLGRGLFWLAWPALYVYMRHGARTRVYVFADEQLLLVQGWLSDGGWKLPGGGLHRGEDIRAGAAREVLEETGITIEPGALTPLRSEWRRSHGLESYLHFFAVSIEQPGKPHRQCGEILAVRWFPVNELPDAPFKTEVEQAFWLVVAHA